MERLVYLLSDGSLEKRFCVSVGIIVISDRIIIQSDTTKAK